MSLREWVSTFDDRLAGSFGVGQAVTAVVTLASQLGGFITPQAAADLFWSGVALTVFLLWLQFAVKRATSEWSKVFSPVVTLIYTPFFHATLGALWLQVYSLAFQGAFPSLAKGLALLKVPLIFLFGIYHVKRVVSEAVNARTTIRMSTFLRISGTSG